MKKFRDAIVMAFPYTLPVLTGYLFVGIAYGIYVVGMGFNAAYAGLTGIIIFAGSMQFVVIDLIASGAGLFAAFFMTLMVNARHVFYSLSMLEKFKIFGKKKPYMIYSLTDEMFSLLVGTKPPEGVSESYFFFCVSALCQAYWVLGSIFGALLGQVITFNMQGIDFVMTALFVVIFLDQWLSTKEHTPALIGLLVSTVCLVLFGSKIFILPSMAAIIVLLTAFRKTFEKREVAANE